VQGAELQASVVIATRNRVSRLAALLESLRRQTLDRDDFEVVVVDDGSSDGTSDLLAEETERGRLRLRSLRHPQPHGPGAARNTGWRSARSELVAFIDDDCVASPGWLAAGIEVCRHNQGAIVQGRTDPIPEEERRAGPFSYTLRIDRLGPHYETCNIFYPRPLLERLGGFDVVAFPGGGEDSDLAWRAIESGAATVFAPDALAFHAVHDLGPIGHLRRAWHWTDTMLVFARHPGLREAHLFRGAFWKVEHYGLTRVLLVPLIPRSMRLLRRWFAWRYLAELGHRGSAEGGPGVGLLLIPYLVLHDVVEMIAVVRGAIRYRTLVL
jgi:glycosyltransferase involved in cell wall biosynthesis